MLKFIRNKVQEKKLQELEKSFNGKVPEDIATNPDVVNLILKYLKDKENDEMPALIFIWNNAGFNDTMVPNCRNGVTGQTQATIIANLVTNGAINYMNMNTLFIFQKGEAIGNWAKNGKTTSRGSRYLSSTHKNRIAMRHKINRFDSGTYYAEGDTSSDSDTNLDTNTEPEPKSQPKNYNPFDAQIAEIDSMLAEM
ncbi:22_t:CDS:2 [Entrophospora sp. SA101]|nr:22_t:CDS:2 [Entrophospora sp. SA101]